MPRRWEKKPGKKKFMSRRLNTRKLQMHLQIVSKVIRSWKNQDLPTTCLIPKNQHWHECWEEETCRIAKIGSRKNRVPKGRKREGTRQACQETLWTIHGCSRKWIRKWYTNIHCCHNREFLIIDAPCSIDIKQSAGLVGYHYFFHIRGIDEKKLLHCFWLPMSFPSGTIVLWVKSSFGTKTMVYVALAINQVWIFRKW